MKPFDTAAAEVKGIAGKLCLNIGKPDRLDQYQRRCQMKKLILFLASLAMLAMLIPGFVQGSEKQVFIVVMAGDPAIAYRGGVAGISATRPSEGAKINLKSAHVQEYTVHLKSMHKNALEAVGATETDNIHNYTVALNGFAAWLSEDQADALAMRSDVITVLPDQMKYPTTDSAPKFLKISKGPWRRGYNGEGIVVGVIDTGIWPEHPSFADDGSYGTPPVILDDSVRSACEFGNAAHNPGDATFSCNNKLIGARQILDTYRSSTGADADEYDSARDDNGHGTHTASTAAGNGNVEASVVDIPRGDIFGIAPRAHIIAYKGLGKLGGYTSDLAAAVDQAVADGVDVINYSIGGGAGVPGADEIAFLFAADAGVFVATSAGNSGPGPGTLGNPGTMPWLTTVGASTQRRFFESKIVLGNRKKYTGASITGGTDELPLVDAADAGNELCLSGTLDSLTVSGKIVLCRRGGSARADKSRAVWLAGGAGMIMYNNSDDDTLSSDTHWVPSVHVDQTPGLAIKNYIASVPDPTARIIGGGNSNWRAAPSMTIFSSRGPNPVVSDIIKPDMTAPGTQILAGYSPTSYNTFDIPGELFAAIQGTSMSSPIVAGVYALLKQARPEWSPAVARSALMTTASQKVDDNDRESTADALDMGAGHITPGNNWDKKKGTITQPGLVYDAGLFEYAAFTCGMEWGIFTEGSCDNLDSMGVPMESYNLNYPSIGVGNLSGSLTVQRTVISVAMKQKSQKYRVKIDSPPGYDVTVSPSTIELGLGESETYTVTITNAGAPVDEWRFGSLLWKGGGYKVYSPIAVRSAP